MNRVITPEELAEEEPLSAEGATDPAAAFLAEGEESLSPATPEPTVVADPMPTPTEIPSPEPIANPEPDLAGVAEPSPTLLVEEPSPMPTPEASPEPVVAEQSSDTTPTEASPSEATETSTQKAAEATTAPSLSAIAGVTIEEEFYQGKKVSVQRLNIEARVENIPTDQANFAMTMCYPYGHCVQLQSGQIHPPQATVTRSLGGPKDPIQNRWPLTPGKYTVKFELTQNGVNLADPLTITFEVAEDGTGGGEQPKTSTLGANIKSTHVTETNPDTGNTYSQVKIDFDISVGNPPEGANLSAGFCTADGSSCWNPTFTTSESQGTYTSLSQGEWPAGKYKYEVKLWGKDGTLLAETLKGDFEITAADNEEQAGISVTLETTVEVEEGTQVIDKMMIEAANASEHKVSIKSIKKDGVETSVGWIGVSSDGTQADPEASFWKVTMNPDKGSHGSYEITLLIETPDGVREETFSLTVKEKESNINAPGTLGEIFEEESISEDKIKIQGEDPTTHSVTVLSMTKDGEAVPVGLISVSLKEANTTSDPQYSLWTLSATAPAGSHGSYVATIRISLPGFPAEDHTVSLTVKKKDATDPDRDAMIAAVNAEIAETIASLNALRAEEARLQEQSLSLSLAAMAAAGAYGVYATATGPYADMMALSSIQAGINTRIWEAQMRLDGLYMQLAMINATTTVAQGTKGSTDTEEIVPTLEPSAEPTVVADPMPTPTEIPSPEPIANPETDLAVVAEPSPTLLVEEPSPMPTPEASPEPTVVSDTTLAEPPTDFWNPCTIYPADSDICVSYLKRKALDQDNDWPVADFASSGFVETSPEPVVTEESSETTPTEASPPSDATETSTQKAEAATKAPRIIVNGAEMSTTSTNVIAHVKEGDHFTLQLDAIFSQWLSGVAVGFEGTPPPLKLTKVLSAGTSSLFSYLYEWDPVSGGANTYNFRIVARDQKGDGTVVNASIIVDADPEVATRAPRISVDGVQMSTTATNIIGRVKTGDKFRFKMEVTDDPGQFIDLWGATGMSDLKLVESNGDNPILRTSVYEWDPVSGAGTHAFMLDARDLDGNTISVNVSIIVDGDEQQTDINVTLETTAEVEEGTEVIDKMRIEAAKPSEHKVSIKSIKKDGVETSVDWIGVSSDGTQADPEASFWKVTMNPDKGSHGSYEITLLIETPDGVREESFSLTVKEKESNINAPGTLGEIFEGESISEDKIKIQGEDPTTHSVTVLSMTKDGEAVPVGLISVSLKEANTTSDPQYSLWTLSATAPAGSHGSYVATIRISLPGFPAEDHTVSLTVKKKDATDPDRDAMIAAVNAEIAETIASLNALRAEEARLQEEAMLLSRQAMTSDPTATEAYTRMMTLSTVRAGINGQIREAQMRLDGLYMQLAMINATTTVDQGTTTDTGITDEATTTDDGTTDDGSGSQDQTEETTDTNQEETEISNEETEEEKLSIDLDGIRQVLQSVNAVLRGINVLSDQNKDLKDDSEDMQMLAEGHRKVGEQIEILNSLKAKLEGYIDSKGEKSDEATILLNNAKGLLSQANILSDRTRVRSLEEMRADLNRIKNILDTMNTNADQNNDGVLNKQDSLAIGAALLKLFDLRTDAAKLRHESRWYVDSKGNLLSEAAAISQEAGALVVRAFDLGELLKKVLGKVLEAIKNSGDSGGSSDKVPGVAVNGVILSESSPNIIATVKPGDPLTLQIDYVDVPEGVFPGYASISGLGQPSRHSSMATSNIHILSYITEWDTVGEEEKTYNITVSMQVGDVQKSFSAQVVVTNGDDQNDDVNNEQDQEQTGDISVTLETTVEVEEGTQVIDKMMIEAANASEHKVSIKSIKKDGVETSVDWIGVSSDGTQADPEASFWKVTMNPDKGSHGSYEITLLIETPDGVREESFSLTVKEKESNINAPGTLGEIFEGESISEDKIKIQGEDPTTHSVTVLSMTKDGEAVPVGLISVSLKEANTTSDPQYSLWTLSATAPAGSHGSYVATIRISLPGFPAEDHTVSLTVKKKDATDPDRDAMIAAVNAEIAETIASLNVLRAEEARLQEQSLSLSLAAMAAAGAYGVYATATGPYADMMALSSIQAGINGQIREAQIRLDGLYMQLAMMNSMTTVDQGTTTDTTDGTTVDGTGYEDQTANGTMADGSGTTTDQTTTDTTVPTDTTTSTDGTGVSDEKGRLIDSGAVMTTDGQMTDTSSFSDGATDSSTPTPEPTATSMPMPEPSAESAPMPGVIPVRIQAMMDPASYASFQDVDANGDGVVSYGEAWNYLEQETGLLEEELFNARMAEPTTEAMPTDMPADTALPTEEIVPAETSTSEPTETSDQEAEAVSDVAEEYFFLHEMKDSIRLPFVSGNLGANFYTNKISRTPSWLQIVSVEPTMVKYKPGSGPAPEKDYLTLDRVDLNGKILARFNLIFTFYRVNEIIPAYSTTSTMKLMKLSEISNPEATDDSTPADGAESASEEIATEPADTPAPTDAAVFTEETDTTPLELATEQTVPTAIIFEQAVPAEPPVVADPMPMPTEIPSPEPTANPETDLADVAETSPTPLVEEPSPMPTPEASAEPRVVAVPIKTAKKNDAPFFLLDYLRLPLSSTETTQNEKRAASLSAPVSDSSDVDDESVATSETTFGGSESSPFIVNETTSVIARDAIKLGEIMAPTNYEKNMAADIDGDGLISFQEAWDWLNNETAPVI